MIIEINNEHIKAIFRKVLKKFPEIKEEELKLRGILDWDLEAGLSMVDMEKYKEKN